MKLKICIIGPEQSGKTRLANYLTPQDWDLDIKPVNNLPRIRQFMSNHKKIMLYFFDLPDNENGKIFSKRADFFIYCIDLSQDLDDETLLDIKKNLKKHEAENPEAHFIIAATKNDLDIHDNFLKIQSYFNTYPVVATSPAQKDNELVYEFLTHFIFAKFKKTRDNFKPDSKMYHSLEQFFINFKEEPLPLFYALIKEAETLINHLVNPNEMDKASPIQAFYNNCNNLVSKDSKLAGVFKSLALAALVFVLASLLGFFIGFSLGAWSGPGAFFTGLVGGMLSAIAVVVGATMVAMGTFGYCSYRVFQKSKEEVVINEICGQAKLVL